MISSSLRRTVFWAHLATGVVVGAVVLLMSVTGVLLSYEKQVVAWADARAARTAPPPAGATRLPLGTLLESARDLRAGRPTAVTVQAERAAPVAVAFGREATVFVDAYRGTALGEGATGVRRFFATVTAWHRWIGRAAEDRDWGKAITGASNLAFLLLVLSGMYLWIPRRWTRRQVRNVAWFRRGLAGKARDFSWHNVFGIWSALPLVAVVASGAVISYPWASDLVYRAVGEAPRARGAALHAHRRGARSRRPARRGARVGGSGGARAHGAHARVAAPARLACPERDGRGPGVRDDGARGVRRLSTESREPFYPFAAPSAASSRSSVAPISASPWAALMKPASNADGAR